MAGWPQQVGWPENQENQENPKKKHQKAVVFNAKSIFFVIFLVFWGPENQENQKKHASFYGGTKKASEQRLNWGKCQKRIRRTGFEPVLPG